MSGGDDPAVSVVVTTYRRNEWLRAAIESALDQTHAPGEVIVVDGSGDEHARAVVDEFAGSGPSAPDAPVTYLSQTENLGPVADRNRGIDHAAGEYVHLLDDDDQLAPTAIERKLERFRAVGDDVGVVYCGLRRERDAERTLLPDPEAGRGDVLELAVRMQQPPIFPSTMLVEADVLDECVPLPEHYSGAGDTALVIELARRTRFDFVDEPLLLRGEAEESLAYTMESVEARRLLLSEYADLYDAFPDEVRQAALAGSYAIEGQVHLADSAWSLAAIRAFALAVHRGGPRLDRVGALVASLFGRRAWLAARDLFVRLR